MASIEMSLGWRRRREALLETLPRAARDLVKELDTLHNTVKEKDDHIQGLHKQIKNMGGTVANGSNSPTTTANIIARSTSSGGSTKGLDAGKENKLDELERVQTQIASKKIAIKNLKMTLDKINVTDNIDVRIRAAELEYELEKEELNIVNLKQEASILTTALQDSQINSLLTESSFSESPRSPSFYEVLSFHGSAVLFSNISLISAKVSYTPGNPPFHITFTPPHGCVIDWATDDTTLKKGDSIIEINNEVVLEEGLEYITNLMSRSTTLNLVVVRPFDKSDCLHKLDRQIEEKTKEQRELVSRLDRALKERDEFSNDNTRLTHRISYLEEQVNDLNQMIKSTKTSSVPEEERGLPKPSHPGATVIQVFQKGPQTLAVSESDLETSENHLQDYPTLPRLKSPSCSSHDSAPITPFIYKEAAKEKEFSPVNPEVKSLSVNNSISSLNTSQLNNSNLSKRSFTTENGYMEHDVVQLNVEQNKDETEKKNEDYDFIDHLRDTISGKFPSYSYKTSHQNPSSNSAYLKEEALTSKGNRTMARSSPNIDSVDSRSCGSQVEDKFYDKRKSPKINDLQFERRRKPRPIPPKKPERLSLQRTSSMQNVEESRPCSRASSASTPSKKIHRPNYASSDSILTSDERYHSSSQSELPNKIPYDIRVKEIYDPIGQNSKHYPVINANNTPKSNSKSTCSQIFRDSRRLTVSAVDYMPSYNQVCSKLNQGYYQPRSHNTPPQSHENIVRSPLSNERLKTQNSYEILKSPVANGSAGSERSYQSVGRIPAHSSQQSPVKLRNENIYYSNSMTPQRKWRL